MFSLKKKLNFWLKLINEPGFKKTTGKSLFKIERNIHDGIQSLKKTNLITLYERLGGFNNLGFFIHYSAMEKEPKYITKIASSYLISREKAFLDWHEEVLEKTHRFASKAVMLQEVGQGCLGLTVSFYAESNSIDIFKLKDLYFRMRHCDHTLKKMMHQNYQKSIFFNSIDGDTKIINLINHFVSKPATQNAYSFVQDFLHARKASLLMSGVNTDLLTQIAMQCHQILQSKNLDPYLGYVHGDFKKNNVRLNGEQLYLIDFSYAHYGLKVWDLGFWFSKEKNLKMEKLKQAASFFELDKVEILLFYYCFILAKLIHVDKKQLHPKEQKLLLKVIVEMNNASIV
jgi:hypothetical protein